VGLDGIEPSTSALSGLLPPRPYRPSDLGLCVVKATLGIRSCPIRAPLKGSEESSKSTLGAVVARGESNVRALLTMLV